MRVGGYQIVDLGNRNFLPNVGQVFDGIYETIEGTRKPILVSGIQINGVELHDTFVDFVLQDSAFVTRVTLGNMTATVTIQDTDVVTVTI